MTKNSRRLSVAELPYLREPASLPRGVPLTSRFDGHAFYAYHALVDEPGELLELRDVGLLWGEYLAERPADAALDLPSPLGTAVYRHYSAQGVIRAYVDLAHDLDGILAPIRTLLVLAERENRERDPSSSWQVGHLIEGAIGLHRSAYDLMHRVVMRVNALTDASAPRLKDSFSKLALKDRAHLVGPLALPGPVADFYLCRAEVFAATSCSTTATARITSSTSRTASGWRSAGRSPRRSARWTCGLQTARSRTRSAPSWSCSRFWQTTSTTRRRRWRRRS